MRAKVSGVNLIKGGILRTPPDTPPMTQQLPTQSPTEFSHPTVKRPPEIGSKSSCPLGDMENGKEEEGEGGWGNVGGGGEG